MKDEQVSQFGMTASDGEHVAVVDWSLEPDQRPLGVVLIVHGLGEHSWRYNHVAGQITAWGFAVRALDLYGHGESGGPRGGLPHARRMLDDLAELVDDTCRVFGEHVPLILMGHSMGGLIAADFVRLGMRPVDGLVMSSPALDPGMNWFQRGLAATLNRLTPNFRVDNGLKLEFLCRDPAVVQAYKDDKQVHRKISARLAHYIASAGPMVCRAASKWHVPTLLMYAGQDKLVNPRGSRLFLANAGKSPLVQGKCLEPMYHEIFNDPKKAVVFAVLGKWLAEQVAKNKPRRK